MAVARMYMYTDEVHIPLSMGSDETSTMPAQIIMYWLELLLEVGM